MRQSATIHRIGAALLLLLALALVAGCGGHGASVSGKVTLNGTSLARGTVSFFPASGGAAAIGSIQADGTYTISTGREESLQPGDYVATVFANEAPQPGQAEVVPKILTPAIYGDKATSPLKFTVKAGSNTIDLPLTGEPPK